MGVVRIATLVEQSQSVFPGWPKRRELSDESSVPQAVQAHRDQIPLGARTCRSGWRILGYIIIIIIIIIILISSPAFGPSIAITLLY